MHERPILGNGLLDALPNEAFSAVSPDLRAVEFEPGDAVYTAGTRIGWVYFPVDCVLSTVTVMLNGDQCATSSVGLEGACGVELLFAPDHRSYGATTCQIRGAAYAMLAAAFVEHCARLPAFRKKMDAFTDSLFSAIRQSVACNRLHGLRRRCACYLLGTQDRVGSDEFFLTQESLATTLGTARPAVSLAAGALRASGSIRYRRGHVVIADRVKLLSASCECYAIGSAALARLSMQ